MSAKTLGILLLICGLAVFHGMGVNSETTTVWETAVENPVYSDPVSFASSYVFMSGNKAQSKYNLYEVGEGGTIAAKSPDLPSLPYQPIAFEKVVVAADHSCMVRGFKVPGLQLIWESGAHCPFKLEPIKLDNEKILVQSNLNVLHCLNADSGLPVWDYSFQSTLMSYGCDDDTVVCLYGYTDTKKPVCKAIGLSAEDGTMLWQLDGPFMPETPLFTQSFCILTTVEGKILIADSNTGTMVYLHKVAGLRASHVFDDRLLLQGDGGSKIICMSLLDGSSWSITTQGGLIGASRNGSSLMLADKRTLRCLNIANGDPNWILQLEDIYNAFPFRNGIFVTYKNSFFARDTYGSYYAAASKDPLWLASDKSIFMKPAVTNFGDLLISRSGNIRMLPKTVANGASVSPAPEIVDPEKNIKFWDSQKPEKSSESKSNDKPEAADKSQAKDPLALPDDVGW